MSHLSSRTLFHPPLHFVPGITETIAQLASGWVTDRNLFHKYHYHKAYLILCGLVNLLSPLATSYILLMVYAVFFAIFCGGYMALLLPVLVRKTCLDMHCSSLNLIIHYWFFRPKKNKTKQTVYLFQKNLLKILVRSNVFYIPTPAHICC